MNQIHFLTFSSKIYQALKRLSQLWYYCAITQTYLEGLLGDTVTAILDSEKFRRNYEGVRYQTLKQQTTVVSNTDT